MTSRELFYYFPIGQHHAIVTFSSAAHESQLKLKRTLDIFALNIFLKFPMVVYSLSLLPGSVPPIGNGARPPLASRHIQGMVHLTTFVCIYENWWPSKLLDDAFKKAKKSRIYDERGLTRFRERLEKYNVRIRKIVNGAVAFSHLFDSLIEYVNKNLEDSFTDSSKKENIKIMMYWVGCAYKQIDEGWRFSEGDDLDKDCPLNEIKKPCSLGYTGDSLDDYLPERNKRKLDYTLSRVGLYSTEKPIVKKMTKIVYDIADLMQGYYEEFRKICERCGRTMGKGDGPVFSS